MLGSLIFEACQGPEAVPILCSFPRGTNHTCSAGRKHVPDTHFNPVYSGLEILVLTVIYFDSYSMVKIDKFGNFLIISVDRLLPKDQVRGSTERLLNWVESENPSTRSSLSQYWPKSFKLRYIVLRQN